MTFKYLVRVCTSLLVAAACVAVPAPSPAPTTPPPTPSAVVAPPASPGLVERPISIPLPGRRWYTVPNALDHDDATVAVTFPAVDAAPGLPRARIDDGATVAMRYEPVTLASGAQVAGNWVASVPLAGVAPGQHSLEVVVRLRDGTDVRVASEPIVVSQPEYIVWTLDFEGDAASNETMDNTWDIARTLGVPMTIMWNPRAWTTAQVTRERAAVMQSWMENIARVGMAEIALHVHMWNDFVAAAGITPRLGPRWSGRTDGYDVPITAYTEEEQRTLIAYGLTLMSDHGLRGVTTFRAGGLIADAATLRAAVANEMTADCSAAPAGTFGSLRLPWTLAADAQPYHPARDDANKTGDLAILEAPTIGGNTYGYTQASIAPIVSADLAMLAKRGEAAVTRKAITIVSHPGTIDDVERAAIETLLKAFEPLRYDRDSGPLRFVTLRQLATAYGR